MAETAEPVTEYVLDDQVGYVLRLASQRHAILFQKHVIGNLTPAQFSTLLRISQHGAVSQNHLGRLAATDVATIKGVVDRLKAKKLIETSADKTDKRRTLISLTAQGRELIEKLKENGRDITEATLAPLSPDERSTLLRLLKKIS